MVSDGLAEVAERIIADADSGALQAAIAGGSDTWQPWIKALGKQMKRKVNNDGVLRHAVSQLLCVHCF